MKNINIIKVQKPRTGTSFARHAFSHLHARDLCVFELHLA